MKIALTKARPSLGRTFPNPAVGAVVFRGDRVLGRGVTRPPPGAHAEVAAIEAARRRGGPRALRGASLAVTLEPCCFTGRTGPCTDAVIEAGIRRVFVGSIDPHARVHGRGIAKLRRAGIEVEVGVREAECRELHRGFFSLCERGRPFVTLKLATTLDGRIATAAGESRWITGEPARAWVHAMRARSDAVMVGSQTALVDDPELSARRNGRVVHHPVRVVVDSGLRLAASARLYRGLVPSGGKPAPDFRTWVLCRARAPGRAQIRATGAQLIDVPARGRHLDLAAALERLGERGLTSLFVEGGGGLAAALLHANRVDEIHWIQAPKLIGGDGRAALGPLRLERLRDAIELGEMRVRRRGADLHITARIHGAR
ncbi:MAG: bifunctional diaminohydroxyphosphoribosylaminopyrimidine deaminase/5-amino-6-(5-phosphoribosylamino)uracil reductase RibD [bacterium]|nr:bifunctional diaminohydroxyphosphoribosylaminopyrimidine deaminase/5-amino-6-(5-phosphoribosylamino)uracil reductase RibD [bacterium]